MLLLVKVWLKKEDKSCIRVVQIFRPFFIKKKTKQKQVTHSNTNPWSGQYLTHAHSHITRAMAAMLLHTETRQVRSLPENIRYQWRNWREIRVLF